jgi:hypothetical protein
VAAFSAFRMTGAAALLLLLVGCKPAAFAPSEGALLHEPPPVLRDDANGFWNDPASGTFGEISFAPGVYRNGAQSCRPARQTVVNGVTHASTDTTLLYCQSASGAWTWRRGVVCRPAGAGGALTCQDPQGSYFTMPPA